MTRSKVFICYSHEDERWLKALRVQLAPLERQRRLDVWDDTRIEAGKLWRDEIAAALSEARVGVLLVSPDFLASPFIAEHEIPALLEAAASGGARLLCVYLRSSLARLCQYSYTDPTTGERRTRLLTDFQGPSRPDQPLDRLSEAERGAMLTRVAEAILAMAKGRELPSLSADPRTYLEKLRDQTCWIELKGIGDEKARRVELTRVFTRLRVVPPASADPDVRGPGRARGDMKTTRLAHEQERGTAKVELKDLLREHAHLVLVGDPGAGKTTFLRFVALNLARAMLGEERDACLGRIGLRGAPPFPVLVSLGAFGQFLSANPSVDYPPEAAEHFHRYLDYVCRGFHPGLPECFLREHVLAGRCLLLLDGLDEVPGPDVRRRVGAILDEVVATGRGRVNRHVVTCRTRAYQGALQLGADFTRAALVDFGDDQVAEFVAQWSHALHPGDEAEAEAHGQTLLAAIRAHPHVRPLTANPLLLTILAVVHWNRTRLPEGRAELYQVALDHLLRVREKHSDQPARIRRDCLKEIARRLFEDEQGVRASLDRREAAEVVAPLLGVDDQQASAFVEDEELYSGILVSRREGEVEFWHPTFAEYLAAKVLAWDRDYWEHIRGHLYDERWNEVVLLMAGCLRGLGPRQASAFIRQILDLDASLAGRARAVGLVGRILRDIARAGGDPTKGTGYAEARQQVLGIFERGSTVAESVRIEVGEALGPAGDPRISDDDHANRVFIEGGTFWMGAQDKSKRKPGYDPECFDNEAPVHRVTLSDFWIDRYPVTVQQYRRFVEGGAEGYLDARFWRPEGWSWREGAERTRPGEWEQQLQYPNRPVTHVSWHEAVAYCAWLAKRTGHAVRLPTEAQWEYAARGTEGRKYPWGDVAPTDQHANFNSRVGRPTPVGIYPLGATPEGVQDLSGNVWEWCADWWDGKYAAGDQTDPSGPAEGSSRLLRGGGFFSYPGGCRAACRYRSDPEIDVGYVGFRCVVMGGRTE